MSDLHPPHVLLTAHSAQLTAGSARLVRRIVLAAVVIAVVGGVVWAGGREWPATWAVPWLTGRVSAWTGWLVQVKSLWVTPLQGFRAEEVLIQPSGAGRLHARQITARYRMDGVWRGRLRSAWRVDQLHLDPGSWKIRRAEAAAQLSEGPVVDRMTWQMTAASREWLVTAVRARGSVLRFHGAGRWQADRTMRWWVRGQVATALLAAFGIDQTQGAWSPFTLKASGPVSRPAWQLSSKFLTFSMGQPGEPS